MRPLRLWLKGFTAFRDEVELDLSDLDLFAITGPTGSGKSSLLDAMTYALYGKVDRVGKQVGQLVSQGQPGMAVTLEFAVGEERYRVTRRTPVKGASRAVLERLADGGWRQEPANGVREVDAAVVRIVGLDYDAFTRSVLLPQNRFAEFLVGDAAERRRILTELLGLELFERLGKRAGEIRRQAEAEAGAHRAMLEREYAGASEEAVARAEEAARRAAEREARLAEAEGRVGELLDRWRRVEQEVTTLTACAEEAGPLAAQALERADALGDLAERLAEAAGEAEEAVAGAAAAGKEAARAERELREAERRWGKATEVAALVVKAERLEPLRRAVDDAAAELERVRAEGPELERALTEAEEERAGREAQATAAREALRVAQQALEHAQHANLAAAVREHVRVGEACPVCGATVERLPRAPRAPDLDRAKRELAKAEKSVEAADGGMRRAERAVQEVGQRLAAHARELSRCQGDLGRHRAEVERAEAELREALGGRLPKDPVAALVARRDRLDELDRAAREAREAAAAAEREAARAERRRTELLGELRAARAALEALPVPGLVERAVAAGDGALDRPELPPLVGLPEDAAELASLARELGHRLEALAADLGRLAEERAGAERELLAEAQAALEDLAVSAEDLPGLADAVKAARLEATRGGSGSGWRRPPTWPGRWRPSRPGRPRSPRWPGSSGTTGSWRSCSSRPSRPWRPRRRCGWRSSPRGGTGSTTTRRSSRWSTRGTGRRPGAPGRSPAGRRSSPPWRSPWPWPRRSARSPSRSGPGWTASSSTRGSGRSTPTRWTPWWTPSSSWGATAGWSA